jgi:phosphopantothenoylcysteine decarboxylase/phosphopantothenate--cysteine ligase
LPDARRRDAGAARSGCIHWRRRRGRLPAAAGIRAKDQERHGHPFSLELEANPDILAEVAARPDAPFCVGFAAESQNLAKYAEGKRVAKKLALVVGNLVQDGLGGDSNAVTLFDATGAHVLPPAEKYEVARGIVAHIASLMEQRRGQH